MNNLGKWANPDEFSLVLRCTSVEYANKFIEKGSIKFNTPNSWVNYAIRNGEGRGDRLEGTVATCDRFNMDKIREIYYKYNQETDLFTDLIGERLYFKSRYSMQLPCFCVYTLKTSMFPCPQEEGEHELITDISGDYFKDFMNHASKETVESLKYQDKPAVIVIDDFEKFKNRIVNRLLELGLDESEIIISHVSYFDFELYGKQGWWDFGRKIPNELTIKHKRFENQSETRIIIDTDKEAVKNYLYDNPIEIGPMDDIAKVIEDYLEKGIRVKVKAYVNRK